MINLFRRNGKISDQLRSTQSAAEILHKPRQSDSKPMPKTGVKGIPLQGRRKR